MYINNKLKSLNTENVCQRLVLANSKNSRRVFFGESNYLGVTSKFLSSHNENVWNELRFIESHNRTHGQMINTLSGALTARKVVHAKPLVAIIALICLHTKTYGVG